MYCPRCSQEQTESEVKFCSRCGFLLTGIGEVTANNGLIPQISAPENNKKSLSQRLNLRVFIVALQIFSLLLIVFCALTGAPEEVVTAVFGFAAGIFLSLLATLFLGNNPVFKVNKADKNSPAELNDGQTNFALPPQTSEPVSSYAPPIGSWKTFATNDLAPHSVTDRTTKLLNKDE